METAAGGSRVTASLAAVELGRRLLVAARGGDSQGVLQLMAKGAYFTSDWLGTSPLHLAAMNGHADTCAVLLRAGLSRDARTKVERTPLHLAAYGGHCDAARVLLAAGARVDSRDMLAMTPLHWAAARGHAPLATLLLERGADPLARSKFYKTPRDLADVDLRAAIDDALRRREAAARRPPTPPPQPPPQAEASAEAGAGAEAEGARLLRRFGITMLPTDDGGTVLSALRSGRTVVLSDAGKLMLKESGAPPPAVATDTARKVVTLSKKAVVKTRPKAKPAVVKILINKGNLSKLMAGAGAGAEAAAGAGAGEDSVVCVPEQFVRSSSVEYLRVQLLATHAALANVSAELRAAKARLKRYEPD